MNYWHIQLHPDSSDEYPPSKIKEILVKTFLIGMGEWAEGWVQINQFKNELKVGDIVLVRSKGPLALVQVVGDPEFAINPDENLDWFKNRRKVKILEWFTEDVQKVHGRIVDSIYAPTTFASANTSKFIINWYQDLKSKINMKDVLNLLVLKNQIILQGPPGTGKTRMAKEIGEALTKSAEITEQDILSYILKGNEVNTSTGYSSFVISEVQAERIKIKLNSTSTEYTVPFVDIIKAYKERMWLAGGISNGTDTYAAALSKYIYKKSGLENVKLIQFHPSYSYEDFVRGISVKTENGVPKYFTENKIIGKWAKVAFENYQKHQMRPEELSKETWIANKMELFVEEITQLLDTEGAVTLTEKISILSLDDEAFRYKGENWAKESRINFKDFVSLAIHNIERRNNLEIPYNISTHGFHRKTYYIALLNLFYQSSGEYTPIQGIQEVLKNYVLIIDEINRANLPSVLGELIYGLEYRGKSVESMYDIDGDRKIILPPNLYIIGTMNTADRSVGHIDYAIRRRFAFVDVLPKMIPELTDKGKKLFKDVSSLFCKEFRENDKNLINSDYLASDFKPTDVILGHSYFLIKEEERTKLNIVPDEILKIKLEFEIKPILCEYVKDGILSKEAEVIITALKVDA